MESNASASLAALLDGLVDVERVEADVDGGDKGDGGEDLWAE